MSVVKPDLVLVVPVQETFLTVSSPEEVKARLSQPRSPVQLTKEEQAAYEARHTLLAQLHVDAIKRKAQRENERAAEAMRRVRRQEAADKQRLRERLEADEKRAAARGLALEVEAAEKRAKREALKAAFFASRASIETAVQNRAVEKMERAGKAEAKREKMMQAMVHKSAWEVKHALAVATATKEKAKEAETKARDTLQEKLSAAESRRELKSSPPSPTSSPVGSGVENRFCRSHSRARQVAQCLNDEAVALEQKRQRLSRAMESALMRRAEKIEATQQRAAVYKEKAQQASESRRKANEDAIRELRHQNVEKEQAAEVRAIMHLRTRAGRKPGSSFAFDIAVERANLKPPAALVARLSAKPLKDTRIVALAMSAAERQVLAAARVSKLRADNLIVLSIRKARADAAAARRALVLRVARAKLEAKSVTSTVVLAAARAERTSTARKMNKRVEEAGEKRSATRAGQLGRLETLALRRAAADKKRRARLDKVATPSQKGRAVLFLTSRAALELNVIGRGQVATKRQTDAKERRQAMISARVAKAKMSTMLRTTAVKLTLTPQAGSDVPLVLLNIVLPGETVSKDKMPTTLANEKATIALKTAADDAAEGEPTAGTKPASSKPSTMQFFRNLLPF